MIGEKIWLGVDPGKNGGIGLIGNGWAQVWKMPKTEKDTWMLFEYLRRLGNIELALIEDVHSMPAKFKKKDKNGIEKEVKRGIKSTWTFAQNYGFLRCCLIGNKIPFKEIAPGTWQKRLQCLTKGDKNITKAKAQQLFPHLKITHATADAILIAYYAKNFYREKK